MNCFSNSTLLFMYGYLFVSFDVFLFQKTKKQITILPSYYLTCKEELLLKDSIKLFLK